MNMKIRFLVAAGVLALSAAPALATSTVDVVDGSCISVSNAAGCKFTGNIGTVQFNADTQAAYNLYNDTHPTANPDIVLNYITDSTAGANTTSGTWSLPGYLVDFLAVKAGNFFVLYKLASPASSGTWNTFQILNKQGNPLGLSHLAFFGTRDDGIDPGGGEVPEPATWAMLLAGFGMVGFASRRRRLQQSVAA